jgi:hypothetical protein
MNTRPAPRSIDRLEFHDDAKKLALTVSKEFLTSLLLRARLAAWDEGAELVLTPHVKEADSDIRRQRRAEGALGQLLIAFGGALSGGGVQGFVAEVRSDQISGMTVSIYALMALIGAVMVFWAVVASLKKV